MYFIGYYAIVCLSYLNKISGHAWMRTWAWPPRNWVPFTNLMRPNSTKDCRESNLIKWTLALQDRKFSSPLPLFRQRQTIIKISQLCSIGNSHVMKCCRSCIKRSASLRQPSALSFINLIVFKVFNELAMKTIHRNLMNVIAIRWFDWSTSIA